MKIHQTKLLEKALTELNIKVDIYSYFNNFEVPSMLETIRKKVIEFLLKSKGRFKAHV